MIGGSSPYNKKHLEATAVGIQINTFIINKSELNSCPGLVYSLPFCGCCDSIASFPNCMVFERLSVHTGVSTSLISLINKY